MHQILNLLSNAPLRVLFLLYLGLSIWLTFKTIWILLGSIPKKIKVAIGLFGISTSIPLLMALDRGNYIIIAVTLGILSYVRLNDVKTKSSFYYIVLLSLAIDIKTYMVLFCIFLFLSNRKKIAFQVIAVTIFSNLITSVFYEAGPYRIISTYVNSLLYYGSNSDPMFPLNGNALVASIARAGDFWLGIDQAQVIQKLGPASNLFGLSWLLIVLFLHLQKTISPSMKFVLMLSCIQFVPPVSMYYTNIWSLFALCVVINDLYVVSQKETHKNFSAISIGIVLIISILPICLGWYHSFAGISWIIIVVVLLAKILKRSILKPRSHVETSSNLGKSQFF
jgi:hypothetical protein